MSAHTGVEVTGRGVVACTGLTVAGLNEATLAGHCQIGDFSGVEVCPSGKAHRYKFSQGAPVRDFDARQHFDERTSGSLDRFSQFAAVAARQAIAEAGLAGKMLGARVGVIVGTANTGIDILNEAYHRYYCKDLKPRPLTVPMTMGSAPASRIAREAGVLGPVFGVTSACASGAHAIALGLQFIRAGALDFAIVGGTDSCFRDGYLRAWEALRVVSSDTCRPFSLERRGLIVGEGAGILVLESTAHARGRGARSFGRLLGAGISSDAGELIAPNAAGMAQALRAAVADSGMTVESVDYINAHGTGTAANDRLEASALVEVFASRMPAVSSTKSVIGHAMGASGALEAITTLAAIAAGTIPPTANFLTPDPECPIDVTPNVPRRRHIEVALSNSFAFGGLNVCLAFSAPLS